MSPKFLMGCVFIFVIGQILALICTGIWDLSDQVGFLNAMAGFNTMQVQAGGGWQAPKTVLNTFNAIVTMLSWDYPFFDNPWTIWLQLILWIVSVGVIWGILQLFVTVIQGLVGFVRNLI